MASLFHFPEIGLLQAHDFRGFRHPRFTPFVSLSGSPASSGTDAPEKKLWKRGEFTGISESSFPSQWKKAIALKRLQRKKLGRKKEANAWVNTVTEDLSERIHNMQWHQALEVFDMLKQQPFYVPHEGTYMRLLQLLGKSGQPQRAHHLFDEMVGVGCGPTSELYTTLLSSYCRINLIDDAFSILNKMKSLPFCQPDVYTYSALIKACIDGSRFDLVESLLHEMSERLINPNTVTQNIVLRGYGRAGKFDEMERVFSMMLNGTTCMPDVWTMNNVLSLFGNKGEIESMERWYEKFRDLGIEPETCTFNILISAYGKKKMYDKMSSVMEYMRRLSFVWTCSTYNNIIKTFSDAGDAKHMEYTFEQMRAEGMRPDTNTFCCLINGYANSGLFHKVLSTAQLAARLEIPETTSFYNAIIYACAKAEDLLEMERVFKRMKEMNCLMDSFTYTIMEEAYRKGGMNDKIRELDKVKQKRSFFPT